LPTTDFQGILHVEWEEACMMRFGVCADPALIEILAMQGYDYLECAIAPLAAMTDGAFDALRRKVEDSPLRCEAGNLFLPGACRLTGEEADQDAAIAHLRRAIPRFSALGGQVAVFGSGGARNVPAGFSMERARVQMIDFTRRAGALCAEYGVRVAVEPLNRRESNIINSVAEGLAFVKLVNHANVGVLADWYHAATEREGTDGMRAAGDLLWHCHIARPDGRAYPRPDDDADKAGYRCFFDALHAIGYQGRVSVEGGGNPVREGVSALALLRRFGS
jgi:sugar phosphate isomerase/epimerase